MKQKTFIYDEHEVVYVIISKNITKDTIKDFDIYYQGSRLSTILDVLSRFNEKTIQYSSLIEKLVTSDNMTFRSDLGHSRTRISERCKNITRFRNDTLDWLAKTFNVDWGLVNWNDYKRKQRKENKKKESH